MTTTARPGQPTTTPRRSNPRSTRRRRAAPPPAAVLVVSILCAQCGVALSTRLYPAVGPNGAAWLRLTWAALFLVAVCGRRLLRMLAGLRRGDLLPAAALGVASASMTLCYSQAVGRIHLGTATAIDFAGPLAVAAATLRSRRELCWLSLAVVGLLLLTEPWAGSADAAGVLFALGSAASWAGYVLSSRRVGARFSGLDGLTLSMVVAALCSAPFGAPAVVGHVGDWRVLLGGAGVAVLMPLATYALDMAALRRMSPTGYGTLGAIEPAVSAGAGVVMLSQWPGPVQLLGTLLVVAAGVGTARAPT